MKSAAELAPLQLLDGQVWKKVIETSERIKPLWQTDNERRIPEIYPKNVNVASWNANTLGSIEWPNSSWIVRNKLSTFYFVNQVRNCISDIVYRAWFLSWIFLLFVEVMTSCSLRPNANRRIEEAKIMRHLNVSTLLLHTEKQHNAHPRCNNRAENILTRTE